MAHQGSVFAPSAMNRTNQAPGLAFIRSAEPALPCNYRLTGSIRHAARVPSHARNGLILPIEHAGWLLTGGRCAARGVDPGSMSITIVEPLPRALPYCHRLDAWTT